MNSMNASRTSNHAIGVVAAFSSAAATAGLIFATGRTTSSVQMHGALLLAITGIAVLAIWFALRRSPTLRAWSIGGIAVTLAAAVALGGLLSQPTKVDEEVVRADAPAPANAMEKAAPGSGPAKPGAPARNQLLARGSFEPLEHAGAGTASIIRTKDGRDVLTLTGGFSTDAGPDLEVWLVSGNPTTDSDVEAGRHVSLGRLKGTSGDQQYVLPKDVDPSEFTHAYVWCRAFSVGFTRAQLA